MRGLEIVIYGAGNVAPLLLNGHSHNVLGKRLTVHSAGRCPNGQMVMIALCVGINYFTYTPVLFLVRLFPAGLLAALCMLGVVGVCSRHGICGGSMASEVPCVFPNLAIESVTLEPGGLGHWTKLPLVS